MTDRLGRLLLVTLEAARVNADLPVLHDLRSWLNSWRGIGDVERGMARQGYDLQLTRYDEKGWRATFYTTGMEQAEKEFQNYRTPAYNAISCRTPSVQTLIEVAATYFLGMTHGARGELSDAAALLERNVALQGDVRSERLGATVAHLANLLSQLGRFDEAIGHAEAAVQIAEAADHPFVLYRGLLDLGCAHLHRGDLPSATRVLERGLDLCRTWEFVAGTPLVAAALGAAHALAGRADEALPLVAGAVEEYRIRQFHTRPALILLCAGTACLSAGRIDEAASHVQRGPGAHPAAGGSGKRGPRPLPRR